ncbi:MAG: BlaI/MecI/CopY family transcriptional regulator [Acidobacteria bacterium]|nr:BlaI/MecI/CopY family transcriptional regulator [Acidobacteriota bacterium]
MPKAARPTRSELAILQVLWEQGPATVRQVHEVLETTRGEKGTGYTTTLKLMQIMAEKGLVTRDETSRTHVYAARMPQQQTQRQLVGDLIAKAFGGSAAKLVMHALSTHPASKEELAEIRRLIEQEKGK